MKTLQSLRYKTRIGLLLALLLGCLLVNNIVGQESLDAIQRDARSIYEDRLMPSTFIFELREHLYQEHTLLARTDGGPAIAGQLRQHRDAVDQLIGKYEKTVLTPDERREWQSFKAQLALLHGDAANEPAFDQALLSLTRLNAIQAGVAKSLESRMTAAAGASTLRSYFEIGLLITIGAVTLSLIGYSRNVFQKTISHHPSLN